MFLNYDLLYPNYPVLGYISCQSFVIFTHFVIVFVPSIVHCSDDCSQSMRKLYQQLTGRNLYLLTGKEPLGTPQELQEGLSLCAWVPSASLLWGNKLLRRCNHQHLSTCLNFNVSSQFHIASTIFYCERFHSTRRVVGRYLGDVLCCPNLLKQGLSTPYLV